MKECHSGVSAEPNVLNSDAVIGTARVTSQMGDSQVLSLVMAPRVASWHNSWHNPFVFRIESYVAQTGLQVALSSSS